MKNFFGTAYTIIAGLTLVTVGSYIALSPADYVVSLGESSTPSTGLVSDLRGMGGMMLFLGVFIVTSVFRASLRYPALLISTIVYTAFVAFRLSGFVLDGLPQMTILYAFIIECIFAFIGGAMLIRNNIHAAEARSMHQSIATKSANSACRNS